MNKKLKLKETVEYLLKHDKVCRDCDRNLLTKFWRKEMGINGWPDSLFLDKYTAGVLTSAEAIRRSRQKLQENDQSLRGMSYGLRGKEKREAVQQAVIMNKVNQLQLILG